MRAFPTQMRQQMINANVNQGNIKGLMLETREFGSSLGFGRLGHRPFVSAIPVPP